MLMVSISCTSARPIPTATACRRISGSSSTRSSGVSCLESLTPLIRAPGRRMTAAAMTGPASGAIPTSSPQPARARYRFRRMLIFYDAPVSGNTYKVRLLLKQLSIRHEVVRLDIVGGAVRTPEYRKVNPFGRVPFIVEDGFALGESNAILLY